MQFNDAKTTGNPLVVSAFLHASIRRHLESIGLSAVSEKITGVKVTANSIIILTGTPLINAELRLHREPLLTVIREASVFLRQGDLAHKKILFH